MWLEMKTKIIPDKEQESLDELVVRARSDAVLKDMMKGRHFPDRDSMEIELRMDYVLQNPRTSVCLGNHRIITGDADGKICLYSSDLVILDNESTCLNNILMMDMPTDTSLVCCDHGDEDRLVMYRLADDMLNFDGNWIKPTALTVLPGKPLSLTSTKNKILVLIDNEMLIYRISSDLILEKKVPHSFVQLKHYAAGPGTRMIDASKTEIWIDRSDEALGWIDLKKYVRDPEILKVQYRNNLVAVSFKCKPEMQGFAFLQADYSVSGSKLKVLDPLVKCFRFGNKDEFDSGFYVTNDEITDISISPDGKHFGVLRNDTLDYYEIKNGNKDN
jgi:hypothetical protein